MAITDKISLGEFCCKNVGDILVDLSSLFLQKDTQLHSFFFKILFYF